MIPWPHIAVSMANLPDGRVLTWSGSERTTWPTTEQTFSGTWNPATGEFVEIFHDSHNMFCAHLAMTEDGKVFVNGGRNKTNSPWTSLFDYENDQWIQVENMTTGGRWYPTTLALPGGSIMTSMGTASNFRNPEKWSATDGWSVLNGVDFNDMRQTRDGTNGERRWWPILSVAPSGEVFHFWDSDDSYVINTDGVGGYENANATTDDPTHAPGVSIVYDVGKMLVTGSNQGSWDGPSASAFVVDLNGPSPQITATDPMNFARRFQHLVPLPTGEVLVVGGNTGRTFTDDGSVMETEIWNPATGQWRVTASLDVPRNYHSTALLLIDGRVLAAGGGYAANQEISGNHQDGQLFSPPYLFAPDGSPAVRPNINSGPGTVRAGEPFTLSATAGLTDFTMIKMSATTHAVNTDVRLSHVAFTEDSPGSYTLSPHANENVLIPGYWMLFALNSEGVPSVAHVVRVDRVGNLPPPPAPGTHRYVKLVAFGELAGQPWTSIAEFGLVDIDDTPIPRGAWVVSADSHEPDTPPSFAIDGDTSTIWHSEWRAQDPPHPHELIVDLGQGYHLGGFTYLPRQDMPNGRISDYEFYVSTDGINWGDAVVSGTFPNTTAQQEVALSVSVDLFSVELSESPAAAANTDIVFSATVAPNLQYKWSFGDGTPETQFDVASAITHVFAAPGRYNVVVTVRDTISGEETAIVATQIVYDAAIDPGADIMRGLASSSIVFHPTRDEVWNVNPDNDSATVVDASTRTKVAEISVGNDPRGLAVAPDGRIWIINKGSSTISVIDPEASAVVQTITLGGGRKTAPHGIVFDAAGTAAFVACENTGEVVKLDANTLAQLGATSVGARPRHLAIMADGSRLFVSRFITPSIPGEDSTAPDVAGVGGEVVVLDPDDLSVVTTIIVHHSDDLATENTGPGLPNYLGPLALSPAGGVAYLPSKQDNILAGRQRNGVDLTFDQTVRAISSKIDLASGVELTQERIDHDNASLASHAVFGPYGIHLFTALEGNRQIAVSDVLVDSEVLRFDVGRAPQGLALSADGSTLAVHNFMDRSIELVDVSEVVTLGELTVTSIATVSTVDTERLDATVLVGKQLFYDAKDDRIAALDYMSCASCHNAAGADGRTWDFGQFGEGLRNTISLKGHGAGHGPLHWSANFDEVQDFEGQIRGFAQGLGLMSDVDFFTGTREVPLGDPKAGLSADLDALAAYVESLTETDVSPYRETNGELTASGLVGRDVFARENCASCHAGPAFTDSASGLTHDVGTLQSASGPQSTLDTPTLLGLWNTAPYLHDGSAATLRDAVEAHTSLALSLSDPDADAIANFLAQVDGAELNRTVDSRVSASQDDAEESSSGSMNLTSTDLELVQESSTQTVGMRFNAIDIPPGATIENTTIQFQVDEQSSGTATLVLRAQAADSAPAFTSSSGDITSRALTTASVSWSPPNWPSVGASGPDQQTPNLAPILQEVVDRSGWARGSSIVVIVTGSGKRIAESWNGVASAAPLLNIDFRVGPPPNPPPNPDPVNEAPVVDAGIDQTNVLSTTSVFLDGTVTDDGVPGPVTVTWSQISGPTPVTFDNANIEDPTASFSADGTYVLRLTADDGAASSFDDVTISVEQATLHTLDVVVDRGSDDAEQTSTMNLTGSDLDLSEKIVGVRFNGIVVPRGSVITDAYVEFTARASRSSSTSLMIWGEASDDVSTFTSESSNISSRSVTTASVDWSPEDWTADQKHRTPALTAIVQEIVRRPGWSSGNSLGITFTAGAGKREARTFNSDPSRAATLHLQFSGRGGPPVNAIESEEATLFGRFEVGSDPDASGGQYIHVPEGAGSNFSAINTADRAEFVFTVSEAGTYAIEGGVHAANGGSDSFWVRVDGAPSGGYLWDTSRSTSYVDDFVNERGVTSKVLVALGAGTHSVIVYLREDGTRLDNLRLVKQ